MTLFLIFCISVIGAFAVSYAVVLASGTRGASQVWMLAGLTFVIFLITFLGSWILFAYMIAGVIEALP